MKRFNKVKQKTCCSIVSLFTHLINFFLGKRNNFIDKWKENPKHQKVITSENIYSFDYSIILNNNNHKPIGAFFKQNQWGNVLNLAKQVKHLTTSFLRLLKPIIQEYTPLHKHEKRANMINYGNLRVNQLYLHETQFKRR